ncbi:HARB1 nuclease, partial [Amia calva]|nr:HARB1 nuclease [Amia calva]
MRSSTFFYVVSELQPLLERQKTSFRDPVSVEKQVAIALWRFATNLEYRRIGERFGVSCTTVYHCIHDVCQAINKVLKPQFLRQPTEAEFQSAAQGFEELSGLPMCIGAITCTHIPIMGPEVNYFDYYNSNGWHSVSLQGITDHTGKFWDVSVGHPGRAHSARILRISGVWQRATSGHLFHSVSREVCGLQVGYSLAGDCAYPLKPWLLRPYSDREPLSPARQEFNQRVGRAHRVALEALARLKGRWRCLLKRNDCQLWRLSNLMKACCVLHNICETHGDRFFPDWLTIDRGDFPQPVCRLQDQAEEGVEALRTAICEHIQQAPCESLALQTCNL